MPTIGTTGIWSKEFQDKTGPWRSWNIVNINGVNYTEIRKGKFDILDGVTHLEGPEVG
jgi:hypothetical protein